MTHDLSSALDDLAVAEYAEAPASTIDIAKARSDGRRRLLAARLAPIGGGVAVVAACALVVNGLGGTSAAKPAGPASGHHLAGTDPVTAVAKLGWLPDGFQVTTHSVGPVYGDTVTAQAEPAGAKDRVELQLVQTAAEIPLHKYQTKTPVTVAGSQKAYLVSDPGSGSAPADLTLHWQNAAGTWYSLGGDYQIHGDQLKAMLIRVAESVTADDTAIALPLHIEGLPKNAVPAVATLASPVEVGRGGFAVALSFSAGRVSPTSSSFSITAMPTNWPGPYKVPALNGTVTEKKANVPTGAKVEDHSVCRDSNGLHICVVDAPAKKGPDPLASIGGPAGLLDRITSLGTDPANWTTHVVN